jgi:hypothetical protein
MKNRNFKVRPKPEPPIEFREFRESIDANRDNVQELISSAYELLAILFDKYGIKAEFSEIQIYSHYNIDLVYDGKIKNLSYESELIQYQKDLETYNKQVEEDIIIRASTPRKNKKADKREARLSLKYGDNWESKVDEITSRNKHSIIKKMQNEKSTT